MYVLIAIEENLMPLSVNKNFEKHNLQQLMNLKQNKRTLPCNEIDLTSLERGRAREIELIN